MMTIIAYIAYLMPLVMIYIILAQSLGLSAGYAGLVSLSHAAFFGIGAYSAAILSVEHGFSFLIILPTTLLITGIIALIISTISFRTIDEYFVVITLGIQVVFKSILNNFEGLTYGPMGISGIPPVTIFGYVIESNNIFLVLCIIFVLITWLILHNIGNSRFGLILVSLSEDEIFVQSLGKNVRKAKAISFTISAMLASIAGILNAYYYGVIYPSNFSIEESIFILSIVIIGGMKNFSRIALFALFLVLLPEGLRFIGFHCEFQANIQQIIYGVILILVIFDPTIIKDMKRNISNLFRSLIPIYNS